jgi:hypothetical protein
MQRRTILKGVASTISLGLMVPALANADSSDSAKHNFVLVHGTWHGGWVWAEVAALLRAKGHGGGGERCPKVVDKFQAGGHAEHRSGEIASNCIVFDCRIGPRPFELERARDEVG